MFDIDINDIKPDIKQVENDDSIEMTCSEEILFLEKEYIDKKEILDLADELDKLFVAYENQRAIIQTRNEIPKDPLWIHYSMEAWTISETIKTLLDKFRKFFPKVFTYINSFVIIRTKASKLSCQKWLNVLLDTSKDQDKIDSIFSKSDTKSAKIEDVVNAINSADNAYKKFFDQANTVKGFKRVTESDKDKMQEIFVTPTEYQTFLDNKKKVDDALPSNENQGANGFTYKDGSWDDAAKVKNLVEALDKVCTVLENTKRLQMTCDEMVRDLSKEQKGEAAEKDMVKELNNEKIKFLKELSKKVLSSMMESIGNLGSLAAKNCKMFCNQYEKGTEQ